jgi:hypothetical protein
MATPGQKKTGYWIPHRLHYALPGWDAAAERRDTRNETSSTAQPSSQQPRQGRGLTATSMFDADHGFAFDGVGRPAH